MTLRPHFIGFFFCLPHKSKVLGIFFNLTGLSFDGFITNLLWVVSSIWEITNINNIWWVTDNKVPFYWTASHSASKITGFWPFFRSHGSEPWWYHLKTGCEWGLVCEKQFVLTVFCHGVTYWITNHWYTPKIGAEKWFIHVPNSLTAINGDRFLVLMA